MVHLTDDSFDRKLTFTRDHWVLAQVLSCTALPELCQFHVTAGTANGQVCGFRHERPETRATLIKGPKLWPCYKVLKLDSTNTGLGPIKLILHTGYSKLLPSIQLKCVPKIVGSCQ